MDTKVIIKPSIARKLFHMGNELIDFKPKKHQNNNVLMHMSRKSRY